MGVVGREWTAGRYRWRTRLRTVLPMRLGWLAPKALGDCGNHEWYNADEHVEHCYHCMAERPYSPDHFQ